MHGFKMPVQNQLLGRRWFLPALALLLTALICSGHAASRIVAWGDLSYDMTIEVPGSADLGLTEIASGDYHSLALASNGSVLAWGDDRFNQTNLPALLALQPATAIAAGNIHNLALMQDKTVVAWGPAPGEYGDYGQCVVPPDLGPVIQVSAGAVHSVALRSDGGVVAWGANWYGQCSVPA